jgi:hypothetical protein
MDAVELLACDFSRPAAAVSELRSAWEAISSPNDIKEEFSLSIKDISLAFTQLSAAFGIPVVDGGSELGPATKKVTTAPNLSPEPALHRFFEHQSGSHYIPRRVDGWQRDDGCRGVDQGQRRYRIHFFCPRNQQEHGGISVAQYFVGAG